MIELSVVGLTILILVFVVGICLLCIGLMMMKKMKNSDAKAIADRDMIRQYHHYGQEFR